MNGTVAPIGVTIKNRRPLALGSPRTAPTGIWNSGDGVPTAKRIGRDNVDRHHFAVGREVEQFLPVGAPSRRRSPPCDTSVLSPAVVGTPPASTVNPRT